MPEVLRSQQLASAQFPRPGLFVMFSKHRRPQALEKSESEKIEMTKHRKPKSPSTKKPKQQEIVEEPVLPGDSLQRVSLRYGCPVSRDDRESVEREKKHCRTRGIHVN